MTQKQRIEELRKQMSISLRAGRMREYMALLDQLNTMMHPKNQLKSEPAQPFIKS